MRIGQHHRGRLDRDDAGRTSTSGGLRDLATPRGLTALVVLAACSMILAVMAIDYLDQWNVVAGPEPMSAPRRTATAPASSPAPTTSVPVREEPRREADTSPTSPRVVTPIVKASAEPSPSPSGIGASFSVLPGSGAIAVRAWEPSTDVASGDATAVVEATTAGPARPADQPAEISIELPPAGPAPEIGIAGFEDRPGPTHAASETTSSTSSAAPPVVSSTAAPTRSRPAGRKATVAPRPRETTRPAAPVRAARAKPVKQPTRPLKHPTTTGSVNRQPQPRAPRMAPILPPPSEFFTVQGASRPAGR